MKRTINKANEGKNLVSLGDLKEREQGRKRNGQTSSVKPIELKKEQYKQVQTKRLQAT